MCRKRLSSPRCRSELIDSAWVVIVPGQKCIKKKKKKGLSYRKKTLKNIVREIKDYNGLLIVDHLRMALLLLGIPSTILFSLLLLFSYCTMVVTCFPIFTTIYLTLDILNFIFYPSISSFASQYSLIPGSKFFIHQYHPLHHNIILYPVQRFLPVNMIPKLVAYDQMCLFILQKKLFQLM